MVKIETSEGPLGHDCAENNKSYQIIDLICKDKYKKILQKRFPVAEIKDTPNKFFPGRFSIELADDVSEEEYYKFIMKEGIADYSLRYLLREISKSPANERVLENLISEIDSDLT